MSFELSFSRSEIDPVLVQNTAFWGADGGIKISFAEDNFTSRISSTM